MTTDVDLFGAPTPKPPEPEKITERTMLDCLHRRYDKTVTNGDWSAPRYMKAEHVPVGLAWERTRIADFIAMDTQSHTRGQSWPRSGDFEHQKAPVFHGHEVKVSRADWLTELRDPTKAEAFKAHMHFWWLVVSDKTIVRDDLPDDWGLMVRYGRTVRVLRRAPLLTPDPMPNGLIGGFVRAVHKHTTTPPTATPATRED